MNINSDKTTTLKEAVARYLFDGCHLSVGGFTLNRNPMAAVYEIIRQGICNLHVYAHSNGQAVDELIGCGCVSHLEIAYSGTGKFMPTGIRFRKAVQEGRIRLEDYTNYQMTLRFLAGAMGVPFLPTRSSLGTDIIEKWGFPKQFRQDNPQIPDEKLVVIDNPFSNWCDTKKVVLVPAINPDVTIIHVQQADVRGNCRIDGLTFADVEQAKAAQTLIITCEELVDQELLEQEPHRNQIPFIHADAAIHVPYGAYPTACYGHYDYDPVYHKAYARAARDDAGFNLHLAQNIMAHKGHAEFMAAVGPERLAAVKADPGRGYAQNLERGSKQG